MKQYASTTDTTFELSEPEVMYTALLAESAILRTRLNDPNIPQERKDEYDKIENILTQCNMYVVDEDQYNFFLKFWNKYF